MQRSSVLSRIFQAACILVFWSIAHGSFAALMGNHTVNNATANGGAGTICQVRPGGSSCGTSSDFATKALHSVDRIFIINSSVPVALADETFILTANGDQSTAAGRSISYELDSWAGGDSVRRASAQRVVCI